MYLFTGQSYPHQYGNNDVQQKTKAVITASMFIGLWLTFHLDTGTLYDLGCGCDTVTSLLSVAI